SSATVRRRSRTARRGSRPATRCLRSCSRGRKTSSGVSFSRASALLALALVAVAAGSAHARPQQLRLVTVFRGLDSPLQLTAPRSQPDRLYVVEQTGRILVAVRGKLQAKPFLDISDRVSSGGERGLLSVAFHPDYAKNHRLFVDYTDRNGDTRVVELHADKTGGRVLPSPAR